MEIKLKEPFVENKGVGEGYFNLGDFRHELGCTNKSQVPKTEEGFYITGLDKYTPSIRNIADKATREKKIIEVEKKREELESRLGTTLDQNSPEGKEYWMNFEIDFDEIKYLNSSRPFDELMITVINANTFAKDFPVASTKEDLGGDVINAKDYYIVDNSKELQESVSRKVIYSRCLGMLNEWYNKDEIKLKQMAILSLPSMIPVTKSTPKDYVFDKLSDLLEGKLHAEKRGFSQVKLMQDFLDNSSHTVEELDLRVTVEKSLRYNILSKNSQGEYYNRIFPDYKYGKTIEDVYAYFREVANQEELGTDKKTDKQYSLKYLIKQKEI